MVFSCAGPFLNEWKWKRSVFFRLKFWIVRQLCGMEGIFESLPSSILFPIIKVKIFLEAILQSSYVSTGTIQLLNESLL